MFQIKQNPTFEANVTIVGQGREQTLPVTFKAVTRSEYLKILESVDYTKSETAIKALLQLIEKWDADAELNEASLALLADHQPGAEWALLHAYTEAIAVQRKGN